LWRDTPVPSWTSEVQNSNVLGDARGSSANMKDLTVGTVDRGLFPSRKVFRSGGGKEGFIAGEARDVEAFESRGKNNEGPSTVIGKREHQVKGKNKVVV